MLINNKTNKLLIHAKIWIDLKEFMMSKKKKKKANPQSLHTV